MLKANLYKKISDSTYRIAFSEKKIVLIPTLYLQPLENGKFYYLLTDGNVIIDAVEKL